MSVRSTPLWRQQAERGSPLLMRALTRFALRFGRGAARAFLPPICAYFIVFSGPARRASRDYLARALGRPSRLSDIYRHYMCFATTILDRVFWFSGRVDDYALDMHGAEHVRAALRAGRGCLLIGAHFGSFELVRVLAHELGDAGIDVLMHTRNARKIGAAIRAVDEGVDVGVIALGEPSTMLKVRDSLNAGRGVGLLADRSIQGADLVACQFLGSTAGFERGAFKLASALDVPILLFRSTWQGGCNYLVDFQPLPLARGADGRIDIDAGVRAYAKWLEHACRIAPYNWFNFYDFWRLPDGEN